MRSLIGVAGQEQGVSDQAGRGHCQIINIHIYILYICVGAPVLISYLCIIAYKYDLNYYYIFSVFFREEKNGLCFQ